MGGSGSEDITIADLNSDVNDKQSWNCHPSNPKEHCSRPNSFGVSLGSSTLDKTAGMAADPVHLRTGTYLYDHVDLAVGSAGFPYGLSFHRFYSSAGRLRETYLV